MENQRTSLEFNKQREQQNNVKRHRGTKRDVENFTTQHP